MSSSDIDKSKRARITAIVWVLRIIVGALFIISGFAKADDLYGSIYKIEEYLRVWGYSQPRSLIFIGVMMLSATEFVSGALLITGCYKRACVWLMLAMMTFFLPLTAWIFITDPVLDCGCFGDMWVMSNGATFVKNILLTTALIFLAKYNRTANGGYSSYVQWLVATVCSIYILIISIFSYSVQPPLDFRSFPVGTNIAAAVHGENVEDELVYEFIYEKDGERQSFTEDKIPDDTSWVFIDRKIISGEHNTDTDLIINNTDGDNITKDIISDAGQQVLICIPEYDRADVSCTYLFNSMNNYLTSIGGSLVCIVAADSADIEEWRDLSMAQYPILYAESTILKELARGTMPAVYIRDGVIQWKRTTSSIDPHIFDNPSHDTLDALGIDGKSLFRNLTLILLTILAVIFMLDRSGHLLRMKIKIDKIKAHGNNAIRSEATE